jgi:CheY-like chemotaxis protein
MARILVADDDDEVREILGVFLRKYGASHSYDFAEDGNEALALYRGAKAAGCPFDLMLLDVKMPGLTGCELTRHVREVEGDWQTLILISTAYDSDGDSASCLNGLGVAARLTKPDDLLDIPGCIDAALLDAQAVLA